MAGRFSIRWVVAWTASLLLLAAAVGIWFALDPGFRLQPQRGDVAVDVPQDAFERRVQAYLMDHPEVIVAALDRMEARRRAAAETAVQATVKARAAELFRDPASPTSGNPDADVTLVEFFDYNCPYCRAMAPLVTQVETADPHLRVVYKEFPILGPNSTFAAKAALAAQKQGKYVAFHRALYQARGAVDQSKVMEVAASVGLDVARLKTDLQDPGIAAQIEKNLALAQALRITGTPGFVAGDQVLRGATDLRGLQTFIAYVRKAEK